MSMALRAGDRLARRLSHLRSGLHGWYHRFLSKPGKVWGAVVDLHLYGGLMLASVGGWQLSPAWTLVVLGLCLSALGIWFAIQGNRPPDSKRGA